MRAIGLIMISIVFSLAGSAQSVRKVKATELATIIAESKTPLVVNMWATWCVPCVEELPYFQEEVKKYAADSVQLLLVSLDFKESFPGGISSFMKKRKFSAPTLWLDETNADYFCPKIDPHWSGAIPSTLFINNKTGYRKFVEEKIPKQQFNTFIEELIAAKVQ